MKKILICLSIVIALTIAIVCLKKTHLEIIPQVKSISLTSSSSKGIPFYIKCKSENIDVSTDNGMLLYNGKQSNNLTLSCNKTLTFLPTNESDSTITFKTKKKSVVYKVTYNKYNKTFNLE